jgi:thiamine-monophosphate kinase
MKIQQWGEEGFIEHLREQFLSTSEVLGIGDDCAVIPMEKEKVLLVTTDALVEGIHFLKDQISPQDLGYKAITVNISDIAAKGGRPLYAFLSIALPLSVDKEWLQQLTVGLKEGCDESNILLLGGDTVGSKRDIFLNISLIGTSLRSHVKYRHTAKVGDLICVSGFLGDSGGGLLALQKKVQRTEDIEQLIHAHFHPRAHLNEGIWLAGQENVHAMMDLSDGLDCDLKRLLKASHCSGEIEVTDLPISTTLKRACSSNGWDAERLALTGGEDYCLLFTVEPHAWKEIERQFQTQFGYSLYRIGQITEQAELLTYRKNDHVIDLSLKSFTHFHEK